MKRVKGVVPYEGPDKMHQSRRKEVLSEARFLMKYLKCKSLEGFRIYVVVRDEVDRQTHIFVRGKETSGIGK